MANTPEVNPPPPAVPAETSRRTDHWIAGRLALIYAGLSGLWIVVSDRVVSTVPASSPQTIKGLGFVLVSAFGLHWLTYRSLRRGRMHEQDRRFFADLADHARDAVLAADPAADFSLVYLNAAARAQLGEAATEPRRQPLWELLPDLDRSRCEKAWREVQAGRPVQLRLPRNRPDGTQLILEVSLSLLRHGNRQLLSGRLWDITDLAAEEARQRQLSLQLAESQKQLGEQQVRLERSRDELELFNQLSVILLSQSAPATLVPQLETALTSAFHAAGARVALANGSGALQLFGHATPAARAFPTDERERLLGNLPLPASARVLAGPLPLPGTELESAQLLAIAIVLGGEVLGEIWLGGPGFPEGAAKRLERVAQYLAPALRSYLAEIRFTAERERTLAIALANEAKFSAIFHNSLDALFLVDGQSGRITDCNRQAAQLFAGGDAQRLIGLEGRLLAARPRTAAEAASLRASIAEGFAYEGDFEYRTLAGRNFWGHVAGEQLDMPGTDLQLFRILDISQRKAADQKLAAQAQFQQALIDSVPLPIFVKDTNSRYLECNRALAEFIGVPREQLLGKTVTDVFPEDLGTEYRRRDEELFLHQGRQIYRGTVRRVCGTARTVIFHKATFLQPDGSLGGLIGTFIDVTDSDAALQRLRLQESALNAAANGIMISDRNGVILWANPACERLTGYPVTELQGASLRLLKSGQQDDAFYQNLWQTVLAGQVWQGELVNRRKDGTLYHEEMTVTPLRDDAGQVAQFIAIKQDISSRKAVELQYLRAQRMEGVGLLASGIAHDLNNVLAPVLLSIELLQAMHPDADTQEILHTVEQSARRGADIVRQVLTFARGVKGERIPLQPKHLVKDIVRVAKETFPKSIEVHIRMDTEVANVEGDPTQIHQVLLNLAVNARDAMPDGGRLTLSARNHSLTAGLPGVNGTIPPGDYVILGVKDTGIGLEPESVSRIFEPFYTTKAANKGTGLGLPTAMGIVKSHAGFFRVVSEPGKGAEFEVYLPVCHRDEARPAPGMAKAPRGNGETVLVVDDEPGIRSITSEILSRHGYRVLIASDGTDAMALVAQHRGKVELVLTDVMMPHMDGVALVRSLRKLAPNTRVLAFSGLSRDATLAPKIEELRRLGLPPVLSKPLAAPELLMALHELLNSPPQG